MSLVEFEPKRDWPFFWWFTFPFFLVYCFGYWMGARS